jgi:hypothetical protein
MTQNVPNPNNQLGFQKLWTEIQNMKSQLAAFLTTIPIKDNHGNTVALIGNIATDPQTGASTGLSGFGIASKKTGAWVSL